MCSWCYGFGKSLDAALAALPGLALEIIVGGVRNRSTELLDEAGKQFRLAHWERVKALTGLPFNRTAFLAREGFIYDTEPACRAVVAVRRLVGAEPLLTVFRALQHAFYAEGRDTTDVLTLSEVAATALQSMQYPAATEAMLALMHDPAVIAETQTEIRRARALGARSFPTLLVDRGGAVETVGGFLDAEALIARLRELGAGGAS
jgi:putative protein-disulfide isomerase